MELSRKIRAVWSGLCCVVCKSISNRFIALCTSCVCFRNEPPFSCRQETCEETPNTWNTDIRVTTDPPAEVRPRFVGNWFPDAFAHSMLHYIQALDEGKPYLCSGRHNLQVVALIEAGYRSVQEGREVTRTEIMGEDA
ncbi:MAG: Gfo/Idh/MocA family oxidoreductase [Armatimonadota bacterium]